jgi:NAD(P)H dehydrogenase (quinone)
MEHLMTTYAVTAATGQLGRLVITDLLDRGVAPANLVAVARDRTKAVPLAEAGVQVRVADYEEPGALKEAFAGVDRLLLISSSSPVPGQRAAQHRNAIDAATATGVRRIVYTSLLRADSNTMPLGEEHRITEQLLRDSGLPAVILRNGWYVENYTDQLDMYRQIGAIIGAAGEARIAPAPRADYAAAAAIALLDDTIQAAVYELAGPSVTLTRLAAALSEVTEQELPYRDVTLEEYRAGLLAAGLDDGTAGFVTALEAGVANGDLDSDATDLERLLGRSATDLHTALSSLAPRR